MGALTSKQNPFGFRAWESQSYAEVNEAEILRFRVRVERLKTNTIRVLPIAHWVADEKRMLPERIVQNYSKGVYSSLNNFYLTSLYVKEQRTYDLILLNPKAYLNIISSVLKTEEPLHVITGRKLSYDNYCSIVSLQKRVNIFHYHNNTVHSVDHFKDSDEMLYNDRYVSILDKHHSFILLTNPRLDSPSFNSFLYQNLDTISISSFATFNSNYLKEEYPLTTLNLIESIQGKIDLFGCLIITSIQQKLSPIKLLSLDNILTLTPLFLQSNIPMQTIPRYTYMRETFIDFSYQTKEAYVPSVIGVYNAKANKGYQPRIAIPVLNNVFDRYLLTKINQKFMTRLALLFKVIRPLNSNNVLETPILGIIERKSRYIAGTL